MNPERYKWPENDERWLKHLPTDGQLDDAVRAAGFTHYWDDGVMIPYWWAEESAQ